MVQYILNKVYVGETKQMCLKKQIPLIWPIQTDNDRCLMPIISLIRKLNIFTCLLLVQNYYNQLMFDEF